MRFSPSIVPADRAAGGPVQEAQGAQACCLLTSKLTKVIDWTKVVGKTRQNRGGWHISFRKI